MKSLAEQAESGDYHKAAVSLNVMLNDDPEDAMALWLLGQCAMKGGNYGLAVQLFRRCVALDTERLALLKKAGHEGEPYWNTWLSFGTALLECHQWADAEKVFAHVAKSVPDDPVPVANLGAMCIQRGRPHEAIGYATRALEIKPDYRDAQAILGFSHLYLRRWREAWPLYDLMIGGKFRKRRVYREPEEPEWDGTEGQTVIVQCEQGMGDEISFASMLPDLQAKAKKVILDTDPRLVGLFKRSFPGIDVYGTRRDVNLTWPLEYEIDAHVHIGSLGKHFRLKDADFPRKPYLTACPERRAKWRKWLDEHPGPKVGISWIGGLQHTNRKFRSTTLRDFAPILIPGATYIDINYRPTFKEAGDWNATNEVKILKPAIDAKDYDDTAALVAELDLVISVTTTAIHLCGALGKECWTLVPNNPQWRYGLIGDDMIWYSPDSVKLYRQSIDEDGLGAAIERLAKDWGRRCASAS